jgi:hypothetical protein
MGLKSWLLAQSLQAGAALKDLPLTDVPATPPKSSAIDIANTLSRNPWTKRALRYFVSSERLHTQN